MNTVAIISTSLTVVCISVLIFFYMFLNAKLKKINLKEEPKKQEEKPDIIKELTGFLKQIIPDSSFMEIDEKKGALPIEYFEERVGQSVIIIQENKSECTCRACIKGIKQTPFIENKKVAGEVFIQYNTANSSINPFKKVYLFDDNKKFEEWRFIKFPHIRLDALLKAADNTTDIVELKSYLTTLTINQNKYSAEEFILGVEHLENKIL